MDTAAEDAESVDQFLARIASLKDRHVKEDEERIRKVEEEILQGRKERQARRAERARSISPAKSSPAPTFSATTEPKTMASHALDPPVDFTPPSHTQTPTRSPRLEPEQPSYLSKDLSDTAGNRPLMTPPQKSSSASASTLPTATTLARSGTLSWQQRPSSRDSNSSHPRPLAASPAPATAVDSPRAEPEEELSRSQIAKSLATKDPTFFRQTADRGIGSAAYRRNESERSSGSSMTRSLRLPGMSPEPSMESEKSPGLDAGLAKTQLPAQIDRFTSLKDFDGASSKPQSGTSTPVHSSPLSTPRLATSETRTTGSKPADTSTGAFPGWGSSRRPPSPTKGLGGFVESAMMKRSDSVSKRWSVQAAPGLNRGNSIASNRSTLGGVAGAGPIPLNPSGSPPRLSRPVRPLSSPSPPNSRPLSSHGAVVSGSESNVKPETTFSDTSSNVNLEIANIETKPLAIQDTKDVAVGSPIGSGSDLALPVSPSKTMDARRWSPTKSSWLESALAKPDSPKPTPLKPQEPAWKSNLHKAKSSVGGGPAPSFEVNTTGLLRSPPMGGHARPLSISGLPESFSSGVLKKSPEKIKPATVVEGLKATDNESSVETIPKISESAEMMPQETRLSAKSQNKNSSTGNDPFTSSPAATIKREPPPLKAKPATPPKTDFRSGLKPRQVASSESGTTEPEFKAVFGKLKRTQTKNYVAPDELKDNITKGKAALNLTGGPQKTKRVDEFKESILQKKEAMKEGTALTAKPSIREKPPPVLPEALAKKEAMKSGHVPITKSTPSIGEQSTPSVPEALARRKTLGKSAVPVPEPALTSKATEAREVKQAQMKSVPSLSAKENEPGSEISFEKPTASTEEPNVSSSQLVSPPPEQESLNSKLAARLNPALAGFLSRGSSPKTSTNNTPAASVDDLSLMPRGLSRKTTSESEEAKGTALTHMTKSRAKGPRRRAPKADLQSPAKIEEPVKRVMSDDSPVALSNKAFQKDDTSPKSRPLPTPTKPENVSSTYNAPKPLAEILKAGTEPQRENVQASEEKRSSNDTPKEKPTIKAKSPELHRVTSPTPTPAILDVPNSPVKDRMRAFDIAQDREQPVANKTSTGMGEWNKPTNASPSPIPLAPSTTKLNTPRSTSSSSDVQQKPPVTKATKPVSGLGLNLVASPQKQVDPTAAELTPPPDKPRPLSVRKTPQTDGTIEREAKPMPRLAGKSKAKSHIEEFFAEPPKTASKAEFDTQAIMAPKESSNPKTRTLSMSIWEITGNGKKEAMPAQQEHILFEDCMYLCVHSFQPESGSKTSEAQLWVGDAVSEAAVEDAQLFCRKIARENGAKLEVLQQGKETANFFQALGGIVITRRNKSSALYMLCGRRHLGHVAFDEVDLAASKLCSGFPYIVSAKFGKLFLWKGRGSGADELGCARLIGMDLGLTGEIEEINEGEEPKVFWESFSSKTRFPSSELWELKSTQDAYTCRLYRVELDRPKSAGGFWGRRGSSPPKPSNKALVEEISPFCQGDLNAHHIYLLDAYFEIYIYVGDQASSKTTEFTTALMLAQEMSMLAPTMQDRPLMPVCHVVFGDPPRDFKATLRKWENESYEKSMVIPLDEAIDTLG